MKFKTVLGFYYCRVRALSYRRRPHWMSTYETDNGCLPRQQYRLYRYVRPYEGKKHLGREPFLTDLYKRPDLFPIRWVARSDLASIFCSWPPGTRNSGKAVEFLPERMISDQLSAGWTCFPPGPYWDWHMVNSNLYFNYLNIYEIRCIHCPEPNEFVNCQGNNGYDYHLDYIQLLNEISQLFCDFFHYLSLKTIRKWN